MLSWILTTVCAVMLVGQTGSTGPTSKTPADTQPTTRPAEPSSTLRKPAQAVILKGLLGRTERPTPIQPQDPQTPGGGPARAAGVNADGQPLLLEGTLLVERRGGWCAKMGVRNSCCRSTPTAPLPGRWRSSQTNSSRRWSARPRPGFRNSS